ncbi:MAG: adenylosuccinate synthase [Desulfovibrionaceae bacterium]|nr:adenylosuccinate synthase [Desulfovibrionaceae bacterium]
MGNMTVIGAQWGDEGKGKIVDLLSGDVDMVVRFQGGNNAGHTVIVNGERYVLHVIPSGILHPGKVCVIGSGVVLDPRTFLEEVDALAAKGIDVSPGRLKISHRAHLIMPYHCALDAAREGAEGKIGTTGRGIGPCYEDKKARIGIRAGDLADPDLVRRKVTEALREKNVLFSALYGVPTLDPGEAHAALMALAPRILPYLADVSSVILDGTARGRKALFEGAQGVMLDIDHGTYPYVTSSNTIADNAAVGAGVPSSSIDTRIAIVKAYTTRVGAGPFPTELNDSVGMHLQQKGGEFGATTGRARRCGWLDAVVLRETARLCAPTTMALTKLDVLGGLKELQICVGYEFQGQRTLYPPQGPNDLEHVTPLYESLPGWDEDISSCLTWDSLPANTRSYIERVEELMGVRAGFISVGPDRRQTIRRHGV